MALAPPSADAATYLFHLSCVDRLSVVQWETGVVDPGRDAMRQETVRRFPNCLASTFVASRDANLPVQVIATGIGPLQGVPVIGPLVCNVVGCPPPPKPPAAGTAPPPATESSAGPRAPQD